MVSSKEINGCVVLISAEIILCLILADVLFMTTFASVNYAKRCHPQCFRSLTPYWVVISIPGLSWLGESRLAPSSGYYLISAPSFSLIS